MATDDKRFAEDARRLAEILTLAEAASFLRVSERTVWKLHKSGQVPSFLVGNQIRFSLPALREFARKGHREAVGESQSCDFFCCSECGNKIGTSWGAGLCKPCFAEKYPSDADTQLPHSPDDS